LNNTRFDSSKYRSAFSDYPFADDVDDFPSWSQMISYLEGYVDTFNLRKFVVLETRVNWVDRARGRWILELDCGNGDSSVQAVHRVLCFGMEAFTDDIVVFMRGFSCPYFRLDASAVKPHLSRICCRGSGALVYIVFTIFSHFRNSGIKRVLQ